jgi:hypothetical protein
MTQDFDWQSLRLPPKEMLEQAMDPNVRAGLTAIPISELVSAPVELDNTIRREYVVTLHERCELENFYDEMEHTGSKTACVPSRCVDVAKRRPISRNTNYYLTDAEAEALRSDQRVMAVEINQNILPVPLGWQNWQTGTTWDKSAANQSNMLDWQPLRGYLGQQVPNWGSNGTAQITGTLKLTGTGANVDVVIVDGLILPGHPEYAVNPDGSGGSRVVQFNWFSLNPIVTGGPAGNYDYNAGSAGNKSHGMHVAGIACGNRQGWARDANIYNIGPYGENGVGIDTLMDYVRVWHATKPINPVTGRKNPTISNHSYGYPIFIDNLEPAKGGVALTRIDYRGVAYVPTPPATFIEPGAALSVGVLVLVAQPNDTLVALANNRITAFEVDYLDAMAEGIICVGAAGNSFGLENDVPGGQDFDNAYYRSTQPIRNQNRGVTPSCAGTIESGMISVNNIDATVVEQKAFTSSCGPRSQINAPGTNIFAPVFSGGVADPINASFQLGKNTGTSMASPGVCGALACMIEKYPWVSQVDCINYLIKYSKNNQLANPGSPDDMYAFNNLRGTPNRYLFFHKERQDEAAVYPWQNYWFRPQSGVVYPRRPARNSQPSQF